MANWYIAANGQLNEWLPAAQRDCNHHSVAICFEVHTPSKTRGYRFLHLSLPHVTLGITAEEVKWTKSDNDLINHALLMVLSGNFNVHSKEQSKSDTCCPCSSPCPCRLCLYLSFLFFYWKRTHSIDWKPQLLQQSQNEIKTAKANVSPSEI